MGFAKVRTSAIAKALEESHGIVSAAAQKLGIARQTVYARIQQSTACEKAALTGRETFKDFAETKLMKKIQEEDLTAIKFFLSTQARDRGYGEGPATVINNGTSIRLVLPDVAKLRNDESYIEWLRQRAIESSSVVKLTYDASSVGDNGHGEPGGNGSVGDGQTPRPDRPGDNGHSGTSDGTDPAD